MKITKWNTKKLDNSCFKILQSSFALLCLVYYKATFMIIQNI